MSKVNLLGQNQKYTTKNIKKNIDHLNVSHIQFLKEFYQEEMLKFQILFIIQCYAKQSVIDGMKLTIFTKNQ